MCTGHWSTIEAPRLAEWEGVGPAQSQGPDRIHPAADGDNGTVFQYTNEFHPPGGRLGNVAGRMIVGATSEREAKKSLSELKALLEKDN